jgi:hypothetical protein
VRKILSYLRWLLTPGKPVSEFPPAPPRPHHDSHGGEWYPPTAPTPASWELADVAAAYNQPGASQWELDTWRWVMRWRAEAWDSLGRLTTGPIANVAYRDPATGQVRWVAADQAVRA